MNVVEPEGLVNLVEDLQIVDEARERIAAAGQELDFGQWATGMGVGIPSWCSGW